MHFLHALQALLGHSSPAQNAHPAPQAAPQPLGQPTYPQDPGFTLQGTGARPDITFNPNPNTNIPFSSHNQAYVQQIARMPLYPQFQGGTGIQNLSLPQPNSIHMVPQMPMPKFPMVQPLPQPIKGYGVNGNEFVNNGI